MEANSHFLICTVGGTADPILAAIKEWKPARVSLIPSLGTNTIADDVENKSGLVPPGAWERIELHDAENFSDCVRLMRGLDEKVAAWLRKGPTYDVIVDFTGGTKCMSAALALVSRRWSCRFSYIGGAERTKSGAGVVVSGKEQARVTQNPWNALGYQAIEDACLLFDQQAFMPAANLLENARKAADEDSIKRTLSTLHQLCEGYGLWDRFQHKEAAQRIENTLKNANDLQAMFGSNHSELVIRKLKQHRKTLQELIDQPRSRATFVDLLANAKRRQHESRHDDGVARLYRAIEAIAQVALDDRHGIQSTDNVPLESVPEPLQQRWRSRAIDGKLVLGLQDAYELLEARGDDLGRTFKVLKLHDPQQSPLTARNQSILAHGFQPVSDQVFTRLWDAAVKLGGVAEQDLPLYPRLTNPDKQGCR
jgi:CRISPR-associated protein (TIGR02710 family)